MGSNANKTIAQSAGLRRWARLSCMLILLAGCFATRAQAQQFYFVDCTGTNPYDFASITAAVNAVSSLGVGPVSYILVTGTCTENVNINSAFNLNIGAWYGTTASVVGNIAVSNSESVYFYGLNVSNPYGDGFDFSSSRAVTLDTCTSNGNQGSGLDAYNQSEVSVAESGSFDNNGAGGMHLYSGSIFTINSLSGLTDISNNAGPGVWLSQGSSFGSNGNTAIDNNAVAIANSSTQPVFGVTSLGHSTVQLGTCIGPNTIQGNQAGGFDIEENSELSIYDCGTPYQNNVMANGPVGVSAGFGSQVTLYEMVAISGHTAEGVELYGDSQLNVEGGVVISNNGSTGNSRSAGIVVDGNSEAYLRGGQLSTNHGPGLLLLVNSSTDFTGATFAENSGGPISCDSSSYMVTNQFTGNSNLGGGGVCPIPHRLGNRHSWSNAPAVPNFTAVKNKHAQYQKLASGKPH